MTVELYLISRARQFRARVLGVLDRSVPLKLQEFLLALKMYPHMFLRIWPYFFGECRVPSTRSPRPSERDDAQAAVAVHKSGGSNSLSVTRSLGRELKTAGDSMCDAATSNKSDLSLSSLLFWVSIHPR